mmetsp:Transcript_84855/g.263939  ORF Transcript_84855/g.263939 Transcript_84855/m.263939 type:complete len:275 (-) Transcript_84855:1074-1898(-)
MCSTELSNLSMQLTVLGRGLLQRPILGQLTAVPQQRPWWSRVMRGRAGMGWLPPARLKARSSPAWRPWAQRARGWQQPRALRSARGRGAGAAARRRRRLGRPAPAAARRRSSPPPRRPPQQLRPARRVRRRSPRRRRGPPRRRSRSLSQARSRGPPLRTRSAAGRRASTLAQQRPRTRRTANVSGRRRPQLRWRPRSSLSMQRSKQLKVMLPVRRRGHRVGRTDNHWTRKAMSRRVRLAASWCTIEVSKFAEVGEAEGGAGRGAEKESVKTGRR